MTIERWQTFSELMSLRQAMDRLFEDTFIRPSHLLTTGGIAAPALDVYHTPNEMVVKAALPAMNPANVDIDIAGDTLILKEETNAEQEIKKEDYLYQEKRYGVFSRNVVLPGGLQRDKAGATMEDGVLTLTIPKAEGAKPKLFKVKAKEKK